MNLNVSASQFAFSTATTTTLFKQKRGSRSRASSSISSRWKSIKMPEDEPAEALLLSRNMLDTLNSSTAESVRHVDSLVSDISAINQRLSRNLIGGGTNADHNPLSTAARQSRRANRETTFNQVAGTESAGVSAEPTRFHQAPPGATISTAFFADSKSPLLYKRDLLTESFKIAAAEQEAKAAQRAAAERARNFLPGDDGDLFQNVYSLNVTMDRRALSASPEKARPVPFCPEAILESVFNPRSRRDTAEVDAVSGFGPASSDSEGRLIGSGGGTTAANHLHLSAAESLSGYNSAHEVFSAESKTSDSIAHAISKWHQQPGAAPVGGTRSAGSVASSSAASRGIRNTRPAQHITSGGTTFATWVSPDLRKEQKIRARRARVDLAQEGEDEQDGEQSMSASEPRDREGRVAGHQQVGEQTKETSKESTANGSPRNHHLERDLSVQFCLPQAVAEEMQTAVQPKAEVRDSQVQTEQETSGHHLEPQLASSPKNDEPKREGGPGGKAKGGIVYEEDEQLQLVSPRERMSRILANHQSRVEECLSQGSSAATVSSRSRTNAALYGTMRQRTNRSRSNSSRSDGAGQEEHMNLTSPRTKYALQATNIFSSKRMPASASAAVSQAATPTGAKDSRENFVADAAIPLESGSSSKESPNVGTGVVQQLGGVSSAVIRLSSLSRSPARTRTPHKTTSESRSPFADIREAASRLLNGTRESSPSPVFGTASPRGNDRSRAELLSAPPTVLPEEKQARGRIRENNEKDDLESVRTPSKVSIVPSSPTESVPVSSEELIGLQQSSSSSATADVLAGSAQRLRAARGQALDSPVNIGSVLDSPMGARRLRTEIKSVCLPPGGGSSLKRKSKGVASTFGTSEVEETSMIHAISTTDKTPKGATAASPQFSGKSAISLLVADLIKKETALKFDQGALADYAGEESALSTLGSPSSSSAVSDVGGDQKDTGVGARAPFEISASALRQEDPAAGAGLHTSSPSSAMEGERNNAPPAAEPFEQEEEPALDERNSSSCKPRPPVFTAKVKSTSPTRSSSVVRRNQSASSSENTELLSAAPAVLESEESASSSSSSSAVLKGGTKTKQRTSAAPYIPKPTSSSQAKVRTTATTGAGFWNKGRGELPLVPGGAKPNKGATNNNRASGLAGTEATKIPFSTAAARATSAVLSAQTARRTNTTGKAKAASSHTSKEKPKPTTPPRDFTSFAGTRIGKLQEKRDIAKARLQLSRSRTAEDENSSLLKKLLHDPLFLDPMLNNGKDSSVAKIKRPSAQLSAKKHTAASHGPSTSQLEKKSARPAATARHADVENVGQQKRRYLIKAGNKDSTSKGSTAGTKEERKPEDEAGAIACSATTKLLKWVQEEFAAAGAQEEKTGKKKTEELITLTDPHNKSAEEQIANPFSEIDAMLTRLRQKTQLSKPTGEQLEDKIKECVTGQMKREDEVDGASILFNKPGLPEEVGPPEEPDLLSELSPLDDYSEQEQSDLDVVIRKSELLLHSLQETVGDSPLDGNAVVRNGNSPLGE
ncbi:unnamed protein product [Amoebophrya sp. A120]|nr:unnamed protein product [Amoebophrya sp. A120]|eukprot:GSA120T00005007001.1